MFKSKWMNFMLCMIVIAATWNSYNIKYDKLDIKYKALNQELVETQENLEEEMHVSDGLNNEISDIQEKLSKANKTIDDLKDSESELVYIGDFKLTHYCNEQFEHICGYGNGLTATGTQTTVGRTIAVDPKVIPYGTKVYIEGYGWRTAEDCGGAVNGNHIDILVNTHDQAESIGVKNGGVWILVKKS